MYYRWRNYAPGVGRFMWRDPIGYDGGVNVYGYVDGNPGIYNDAYGNKLEHYSLLLHWYSVSPQRIDLGYGKWTRDEYYVWEENKYDVEFDVDRECSGKEARLKGPLNLKGNEVGAFDSLGFSFFWLGVTSSVFVKGDSQALSASCGDDLPGGAVGLKISLSVVRRRSAGVNPGYGLISFDFGLSVQLSLDILTTVDVAFYEYCCCKQKYSSPADISPETNNNKERIIGLPRHPKFPHLYVGGPVLPLFKW